jgi:pimeloyl-ACP methyl ester carboxylesterase
MTKGLVYIHGKGGSAQEAEHYKPLFPDYDVIGFDYKAETPCQATAEFRSFYDYFKCKHEEVIIVANSIGAYFTMMSLYDRQIEKAYFISPIVDMEGLILNMMNWTGITENQLREKGIIGELSWEYLSWVRNNPVCWPVETEILYGEQDNLQSIETIRDFSGRINADVTVMKGGEHWFHTPQQMAFLDNWIKNR